MPDDDKIIQDANAQLNAIIEATDAAAWPYHAGRKYALEHPEWYTDEHPNSSAYRMHQGLMHINVGREAGVLYGRDDDSVGRFVEGFFKTRIEMNREEAGRRR